MSSYLTIAWQWSSVVSVGSYDCVGSGTVTPGERGTNLAPTLLRTVSSDNDRSSSVQPEMGTEWEHTTASFPFARGPMAEFSIGITTNNLNI
jgi:hypothetical protein